MPEIEITDDQREYLEDLRAQLEEDVVYGHVRLADALQYLIDSREGEPSAGADATDSEASGADGVSGDGADAASSDEEGTEEEGDGEAGDAADSESDGETDEDGESDADEDATAEDGDDAAAESAAAPTPGGGDRLNAMMQLLDTHDDKWREGSGDARYEVDLPDGSTETANTKDDVRALLFKNY